MRVASFDIGSNTVLMLVAEWGAAGWVAIAERLAITRVSEGLDRSGWLATEPLGRTARAAELFAAAARALGVTEILGTGTAPFRRARNGAEAAQRLSEALGAPLRVVSGEEEAALALLATRRSFPGLERMVVVDIGGASTELIVVDGPGAAQLQGGGGASPMVHSFDVGSVRLTERWVRHDPIPLAERLAVRAAVREALATHPLGGALVADGRPLVGIAGTVTTLAAMVLGLEAYQAERVHGLRLSRGAIAELAERLFAATLAERRTMAGLEPERADVIPAGAELLLQVMDAAQVDEVLVSDRGIRWGRLFAESERLLAALAPG